MKTTIIIAFMFAFIGILNAQWGPDVRMTNNPELSRLSSNNARCIASNGNYVHIVYYDARTGNTDIYYKRSLDAGVNWDNDVRLTNSPSNSGAVAPSIALNGTSIHLVWRDSRDGPNGEIYYKKSNDNGVTWDADRRLTYNSELSWQPTVCVSGNNIHVVWYDNRDGIIQVYYKRSVDGGATWDDDVRLSSHNYLETNPAICVSGSYVHVVWNTNQSGVTNIIYKRSVNGGLTWDQDVLFSAGAYPTICVLGSKVYAAWNDGANYSIRFRKSINSGLTWDSDAILTNTPETTAPNPNLTVSGSFLHIVWVVWRDNGNINYEIYFNKSRNEGLTWETNTRLTNSVGESRNAFVSASNSTVHVVWQDDRDGNQEIYYKRDPTGNTTGLINLNTNIPMEYKLSQNYPNPFNPVTRIKFEIPKSSFVNLVVYDMLGRETGKLVCGKLNAGSYLVDWNASQYNSGVYFYKLTSGDFSEVKKMVLIK